ncbi:hypothetical protein GOV10_04470 [Candidatus Woesearchaeota archaeon]|nr:hypothetical protein [Candidatus Woesearchaeota archaeon]
MEQYIIFQKTGKTYEIDFFPPLNAGKNLLEGKTFEINNMTVDELNHGIIGVHQLFEAGLLSDIESIVIEGSSELQSGDDRLLEIFCTVCSKDYDMNVRYQKTQEN